MTLLPLQLNVQGLPVLVLGTLAASHPLRAALLAAGARLVVPEEPYSRRHLTPRPVLIVLADADPALAARIRQDALLRGLLLLDLAAPQPRPGEVAQSL